MNIAICISGEPRYLERSISSIQNIKSKYPECKIDIFCHLWDNITFKNKKHNIDNISLENNIYKKVENKEKLLQELQTTAGVVESKEILHEYGDYMWNYITDIEKQGYKKIKKLQKTWVDKNILTHYIKNTNSPPLSQLISMCKSNMIRVAYEKKNNITYDFVIRTRTDIEFTAPNINKLISEKNRNRNIIFFPSLHYIGETLYVEYCFFIGSSNNLNEQLFNNYKQDGIKSIVNVNIKNKTINTRSSHAAIPYFIRLHSNVQIQSGILNFKQDLLQQKSI